MKNKTNHQMPRCGDLELRHSKEVSQGASKGSDFSPNPNCSSLESSCVGIYSNPACLPSEGHSLQCSVLSCTMRSINTHLGTGTRITVPSTSGFRFMPLSLIAFAAAAVLCKTDQKVKGIRKQSFPYARTLSIVGNPSPRNMETFTSVTSKIRKLHWCREL